MRVTSQLIDTATGTHLWAERYDRDLTDIFAVQDDITSRVAGLHGFELRFGPSEHGGLQVDLEGSRR